MVLHSATLHPREVLADRLWPDVPPQRVRRKLSDVLYRLRRALGVSRRTILRNMEAMGEGGATAHVPAQVTRLTFLNQGRPS